MCTSYCSLLFVSTFPFPLCVLHYSQVYLSGGVVNYPVRGQFQSLGIFVLCSRRLIRSQEDISVVIHGLDFRTSGDISSKLGAFPVFLTAFITFYNLYIYFVLWLISSFP